MPSKTELSIWQNIIWFKMFNNWRVQCMCSKSLLKCKYIRETGMDGHYLIENDHSSPNTYMLPFPVKCALLQWSLKDQNKKGATSMADSFNTGVDIMFGADIYLGSIIEIALYFLFCCFKLHCSKAHFTGNESMYVSPI